MLLIKTATENSEKPNFDIVQSVIIVIIVSWKLGINIELIE